ncbi:hypothetical protein THRCLA_03977 [Thraustotheca clavata]|uniref:Uncharacterized protein n=1 Tax=Thraustotheca clavata TaxID=74557 RepID=A0A1W0A0B6_9STRA|nr:hypothetical protein THRCLA_03977 [Thraustotheca clavata]
MDQRYRNVNHFAEPVAKKPKLPDRDIVSSLLSLRRPTQELLPSIANLKQRLINPPTMYEPPPVPLRVQLEHNQKHFFLQPWSNTGQVPVPTASDLKALQSDPRVRQAIERLKEHQRNHQSDITLLPQETRAFIQSIVGAEKTPQAKQDDDFEYASSTSGTSSSRGQSNTSSVDDENSTVGSKRRRPEETQRINRRAVRKWTGENNIPLEAPLKTSFATSWAQRKHNFELVQLKRDIERCRKEYLSYLRGRLGRCISNNVARQLQPQEDVLTRRIEIRVASMAYLFQSRVQYPCGVGAFAANHTMHHNAFDSSIKNVVSLFRSCANCIRVDHGTIEQCQPVGDNMIAFNTVFWITITDVAALSAMLNPSLRDTFPNFQARGQFRVKAVLTCTYQTFDVTNIDIDIDIMDALQSYKAPEARDDVLEPSMQQLPFVIRQPHSLPLNPSRQSQDKLGKSAAKPQLRPMPPIVMMPFQCFHN